MLLNVRKVWIIVTLFVLFVNGSTEALETEISENQIILMEKECVVCREKIESKFIDASMTIVSFSERNELLADIIPCQLCHACKKKVDLCFWCCCNLKSKYKLQQWFYQLKEKISSRHYKFIQIDSFLFCICILNIIKTEISYNRFEIELPEFQCQEKYPLSMVTLNFSSLLCDYCEKEIKKIGYTQCADCHHMNKFKNIKKRGSTFLLFLAVALVFCCARTNNIVGEGEGWYYSVSLLLYHWSAAIMAIISLFLRHSTKLDTQFEIYRDPDYTKNLKAYYFSFVWVLLTDFIVWLNGYYPLDFFCAFLVLTYGGFMCCILLI